MSVRAAAWPRSPRPTPPVPTARSWRLDPSAALLAEAPSGRLLRVAGAAPGVPFADGQFDAVVANLVVGHFTDYRPALADLVRVLRPGGRLGVTTWGRLDDDADDRRLRRARGVRHLGHRRRRRTSTSTRSMTPRPTHSRGRTAFADPANVRTCARTDANLQVVDLFGRAYRYPLSHADWLEPQ